VRGEGRRGDWEMGRLGDGETGRLKGLKGLMGLIGLKGVGENKWIIHCKKKRMP
jgi:hypothetical protein